MAREKPRIEDVKPLRRSAQGQWTVFVVDVMAAGIAVVAAALLTSDGAPRAMLQRIAADGVMLGVCWLGALILLGEARVYSRRSSLQQLIGTSKVVAAGTAVALLIEALQPAQAALKPFQYGAATVIAMGLFWLGHWLIGMVSARRLERRYLVVSDNHIGPALSALRSGDPYEYHEVVGIVAGDQVLHSQDIPVFRYDSQWEAIPALVQTLGANCVVFDPHDELPAQAVTSVVRCREQGARIVTAVSAYEEITSKTPLCELEGPFARAYCQPPRSVYDRHLKRVVDVVLTLLLLPAAMAIIGVCATLVKIFMPGPVFYRQERVGHNGGRFYITKLRTMVPDAEKRTGPVWAEEGDPRVTPLGRMLRRARIDELPQLFHVLKGEMSLVGPRPERPHFVSRLAGELPSYLDRLAVHPGITGWAQVNHRYDSCFEDVCEKLRYDRYYVRHMSWALDLEILRRTIGVVIGGKGAR